MAYLYLRPTGDVYSTHERFPADSPNVYTLVNEEALDGDSTYFGRTIETANTLYTDTTSLVFAGSEWHGDKCEIDRVRICGYASEPTTTNLEVIFTISFDGNIFVSDIKEQAMLGTNIFPDATFNRNNFFSKKLQEYINTNKRIPDINIAVTTFISSTKASLTPYISQLYLEILYHIGIKRKVGYNYYTSVNRVYKKINGFWNEINNGQYELSQQLNKKGHHHEQIKFAKAATCVADGCTGGNRCSLCGEIFIPSEIIPATGEHTIVDVEATEATCSKFGYTAGTKCSMCGEYFSGHEEIAKLEHTVTDVAATEPTCKSVGYTAGTKCSVCGEYLSGHEEIPKTDAHTPEDVTAVEPTCGTTGYTAGTKCSVCGITLSGMETIPVTGAPHTEVSNNDGVAATAQHAGFTSSTTCSVCGKIMQSRLPIPPGSDISECQHIFVTLDAIEPTCSKAGCTGSTICSVCGYAAVPSEVIPATGVHIYELDGLCHGGCGLTHPDAISFTIEVKETDWLGMATVSSYTYNTLPGTTWREFAEYHPEFIYSGDTVYYIYNDSTIGGTLSISGIGNIDEEIQNGTTCHCKYNK